MATKNETKERALATTDGGLSQALESYGWQPPDTVREYINLLISYKAIMKEGHDYGVIPGTDRPTLLQPGADTLCRAGKLVKGEPRIEKIEDWDRGFFHYEVKMPICREDGTPIAWGVGSCNSKESRYAYRWMPEFKLSDRQRAQARDEGWLKEQRKAKTGKQYTWYRVPNDDPYSLVNTLLKMATKRAYVSATLAATGAHRVFTQDVGDAEDEAVIIEGEVVESSEPPSPPPQRERPAPPEPARAVAGELEDIDKECVAEDGTVDGPKLLAYMKRYDVSSQDLARAIGLPDGEKPTARNVQEWMQGGGGTLGMAFGWIRDSRQEKEKDDGEAQADADAEQPELV